MATAVASRKPRGSQLPRRATKGERERRGQKLFDFLAFRGFDLCGEHGQNEVGHTVIRRNGRADEEVPDSALIVEHYKETGNPSLEEILAQCEKAMAQKPQREKKRLAVALDNVKRAADLFQTSTWRFADALVEFRAAWSEANRGKPISDARLGEEAGLKISRERIGQLRLTAEYWPPDLRDETRDFRLYEEARKSNDALETVLDKKVLADFLRGGECKDADALEAWFRKIRATQRGLPVDMPKAPETHKMVVTAIATRVKESEDWLYGQAVVTVNGSLELPSPANNKRLRENKRWFGPLAGQVISRIVEFSVMPEEPRQPAAEPLAPTNITPRPEDQGTVDEEQQKPAPQRQYHLDLPEEEPSDEPTGDIKETENVKGGETPTAE